MCMSVAGDLCMGVMLFLFLCNDVMHKACIFFYVFLWTHSGSYSADYRYWREWVEGATLEASVHGDTPGNSSAI